jgi:hypothetical protein
MQIANDAIKGLHGVPCRKFATTKQAEMIDINFKQLTRIYPVQPRITAAEPLARFA